MSRQLYRSKNNRMIAGVCGGIGEYFNIDPTLIRILWAAFSVLSVGAGIIAYIIALIVIPEEGFEGANYHTGGAPINIDNKKASIVVGVVLVLMGVFLIARRFFNWFDIKLLLSVLLIALGAFILFRGWRNQ
ncbi:MAG TPA: PspC domain-containing protein [Clostridiaceae bacterium]|nr:PspC domain-containing protein [Clostridiaceae bacterium]